MARHTSCLLFLLVMLVPLAWADNRQGFQPIPADELALKDDPAVPGASALILYREYIADDQKHFITEYLRIKVLTEAGKQYADVEIPLAKGFFSVDDIEARTVRPDGTSIPFTGAIHEKTIARRRGVKLFAKVFTLPDVQVGSIIEYRYRIKIKEEVLLPHHWDVQSDLFTRRAHFDFKPHVPLGFTIAYSWRRLPPGKKVLEDAKTDTERYFLDIEQMPGLQKEEFMPPEVEVKSTVDFSYRRAETSVGREVLPYWADLSKRWGDVVNTFIGKSKTVKAEVDRLTSPSDPPEVKLRKLYARVQQVRNTSYEAKTAKEEKRENLKENKRVDDVLERGYGAGIDVTILMIAMARAAGFQSGLAMVAPRDRRFFHKELLEQEQLAAYLAWVDLGEKTIFLDPATQYCPYGFLTWDQTSTSGIRTGSSDSVFVKTPSPKATDALTERKANLRLQADGSVSGTVTVTFYQQEALELRSDLADEDETGRTKKLVEKLKAWLPASSDVTLEKLENWTTYEAPIIASFRIQAPGYATVTGRRLLLPLHLFGTNNTNPFQHARRVHDVYVPYPFIRQDEVKMQLPRGYEPETLPEVRKLNQEYGTYELSAATQADAITIRRRFMLNGIYFPKEYYPELRDFYRKVRVSDEEQAIFKLTPDVH